MGRRTERRSGKLAGVPTGVLTGTHGGLHAAAKQAPKSMKVKALCTWSAAEQSSSETEPIPAVQRESRNISINEHLSANFASSTNIFAANSSSNKSNLLRSRLALGGECTPQTTSQLRESGIVFVVFVLVGVVVVRLIRPLPITTVGPRNVAHRRNMATSS